MEAKDKFIFPEFDSPKNYPEDYADGHNQYVCKCYKCKEHFYGYKRRIICKECLNTEESENEIMEGKAKEALKEILDRCNNTCYSLERRNIYMAL